MTPDSAPGSKLSTILPAENLQDPHSLIPPGQKVQVSIVVPTYNESGSIVDLLDSVRKSLPRETIAEIVVVDDSSADGTGTIVLNYAEKARGPDWSEVLSIRLITRPAKSGLSSAILAGVRAACGETIVVMDSDLSHPPEIIPQMLRELQNSQCDLVVASRYVEGGSIAGWPVKRRVLSKGATSLAQRILRVRERDPMSGFFAFKREIIEGIQFDAIGYKLLLEILVKSRASSIKEIPYRFTDRKSGTSKLDIKVATDYFKAVWRLYRYGQEKNSNMRPESQEKRASVGFLSKAGRFYTVGATGLLVNYLVSMFFAGLWAEIWYLYATVIGIFASMTSNFTLNKIWTFEDRDFNVKRTTIQYGLFLGFSSIGAGIQLGMLYLLKEIYHLDYAVALILAVAAAASGNFVLNKKWTFRQKVWS